MRLAFQFAAPYVIASIAWIADTAAGSVLSLRTCQWVTACFVCFQYRGRTGSSIHIRFTFQRAEVLRHRACRACLGRDRSRRGAWDRYAPFYFHLFLRQKTRIFAVPLRSRDSTRATLAGKVRAPTLEILMLVPRRRWIMLRDDAARGCKWSRADAFLPRTIRRSVVTRTKMAVPRGRARFPEIFSPLQTWR